MRWRPLSEPVQIFLPIGTVNNAHYLWWSNRDIWICAFDRIQNQSEKCNIKEKQNMKRKLARKLYDTNVWHVNMTNPVVIHYLPKF